jgi:hypothetical protein
VDDADDVGPTSDQKEGRMRSTTQHAPRPRCALTTAAAAVSAAALAVGIGAGSAEAAPAAKWTRLTPPGHALKDIDEIAVDRDVFGALDLVWRNGNTIQHGRLDPDLKTVSGPHTVAAYSGGINGEVDLDTQGEVLYAFFAGQQPGSAVDGVMAMSRSDSKGVGWTDPEPVSNNTPAGKRPVYGATGIAALKGLDLTTYSIWGSPGQAFHVGDSRSDPDTSLPGGASADPGLGLESQSGQVVAAWNLLDEDGVAVMPLRPAGPRTVIPGSGAAQFQTPVSVSGRIGAPGVYVAYTAGSSEFLGKPATFRVGDSKGKVLSAQKGALQTALAPSAEGRMWVFWHRRGLIHARRSNRAMTAWGETYTVTPSRGTDEINGLVGDAAAGPLDLVARLKHDGANAGWHTRIAPKLTITASKKGGKLKIRVADVGDPVAAKVTVKGAGTKQTSWKDGLATFRLGPGKHRVTAKTAYGAGGSKTIHVRI